MRELAFIGVLAVLGGCADRNYAVNDRKMSVTDIVNHVQCEVYNAWAPFSKDIGKEVWVAAVSLTLQETVVNGVNPTLMAGQVVKQTVPITTFGAGLGFTQANQETRKFDFVINIRKIDSRVCQLASAKVKGNLGIAGVVADALNALKLQDYSKSLDFTEAKTFGKSVQFTVTTSASALGPTWTLRYFQGPGGLFSASKSKVNIIDISFGKQAVKEDVKTTAKRTQQNNVKYEIQRLVNPY